MRPRRKRKTVDPDFALAAERLVGTLGESREPRRCEILLQFIERLALALGGEPAQDDLLWYVERVRLCCRRQAETLSGLGLEHFSRTGLEALFLGELFEQGRALPLWVEAKRPHSSYYTPAALAYRLAREALSRRRPGPEQLLLDPCCGSGALLIAAVDFFQAEGLEPPQMLGVDIDPWAVAAARILLEHAAGSRTLPLLVADSLCAELPEADVVLLNPPWNRLENKQQAALLRSGKFQWQSGELSLFKLFLELSFNLLKDKGVMAALTPAGIYSDYGCRFLRRTFFENGSWNKLIGFVNEDLAFPVHPDWKYALSVISRSRTSEVESLAVAFAQKGTARLAALRPLDLSVIRRLSPAALIVPELLPQDESLQLSIYSRHLPLHALHPDGEPQRLRGEHMKAESQSRRPGMRFHREFDMTQDRHCFVPVSQALAQGYQADRYGRFVKADDVLLPLLEGRQVEAYDFAAAGYLSGAGRSALWRNYQDVAGRCIKPQFLVPRELSLERRASPLRLGFASVTSPTNVRTMKTVLLPHFALGNAVPAMAFTPADGAGLRQALLVSALCNSLVFDYLLRTRIGGNNINYYVLDECPLPGSVSSAEAAALLDFSAVMNISHIALSTYALWLLEHDELPLFRTLMENHQESAAGFFLHGQMEAGGTHRLSRAVMEILAALIYGLEPSQLLYIIEPQSASRAEGQFDRVDKSLPEELRLTSLTRRLALSMEQFRGLDALQCLALGSRLLGLAFVPNQAMGRPDWRESLCLHRKKLDSFS